MNNHLEQKIPSNQFNQNVPETPCFLGSQRALKHTPSRLKSGWNQLFLAFTLVLSISFSGSAQNFEIATEVCDSVSPTNYFVHVSGYATFNDSITMTVELLTTDSIPTVVYSASKDFSVNGTSTLTNFTYDATTEAFSLEIGTYSTREFLLRVRSWVGGLIQEELTLDLY